MDKEQDQCRGLLSESDSVPIHFDSRYLEDISNEVLFQSASDAHSNLPPQQVRKQQELRQQNEIIDQYFNQPRREGGMEYEPQNPQAVVARHYDSPLREEGRLYQRNNRVENLRKAVKKSKENPWREEQLRLYHLCIQKNWEIYLNKDNGRRAQKIHYIMAKFIGTNRTRHQCRHKDRLLIQKYGGLLSVLIKLRYKYCGGIDTRNVEQHLRKIRKADQQFGELLSPQKLIMQANAQKFQNQYCETISFSRPSWLVKENDILTLQRALEGILIWN